MADWGMGLLNGMRLVGFYNASTVYTNVAAHTKGGWNEMSSGVGQDVDLIMFDFYGRDYSVQVLFDIGIGTAGNEQAIVSNVGRTMPNSANDFYYYLPIRIPANTRIALRYQESVSGGFTSAARMLLYSSSLSGLKGYSRSVTLGIDTATSLGVSVNVYGNWSEITSATPQDFQSGLLVIQNSYAGSGQAESCEIEFAIGASGSEKTICKLNTVWRDGLGINSCNVPMHLPKNTRLSARITAYGGANQPFAISFIGWS